jgi:hypothetical protein
VARKIYLLIKGSSINQRIVLYCALLIFLYYSTYVLAQMCHKIVSAVLVPHAYWNTQWNILKTSSPVWFNKIYRTEHLNPKYMS